MKANCATLHILFIIFFLKQSDLQSQEGKVVLVFGSWNKFPLGITGSRIVACCLSTWLSVHKNDGCAREKKKGICIIFIYIYIYILCPFRRTTYGSKKFGRVRQAIASEKEKRKNTHYHNSRYRFILYLPSLQLSSVPSQIKERLSSSLIFPSQQKNPVAFTNARCIMNKHNARNTWALGSRTMKKTKRRWCTNAGKKGPLKRASNLQRTSHSGASALWLDLLLLVGITQ